jgi:hypothetical protein
MDWAAGAASWVLTTEQTYPEWAELARVGYLKAVCSHKPLHVTVSNSSGGGVIAMSGSAFCAERVTHSSSSSSSLTPSDSTSLTPSDSTSRSVTETPSASQSSTMLDGYLLQPTRGPPLRLSTVPMTAPTLGMQPTFIEGTTLALMTDAFACSDDGHACAALLCNRSDNTVALVRVASTGFGPTTRTLAAAGARVRCDDAPVVSAVLGTDDDLVAVIVIPRAAGGFVATWSLRRSATSAIPTGPVQSLPCAVNASLIVASQHYAAVLMACSDAPAVLGVLFDGTPLAKVAYKHQQIHTLQQMAIVLSPLPGLSPSSLPVWLTIGVANGAASRRTVQVEGNGRTWLVDEDTDAFAAPEFVPGKWPAGNERCNVSLAYIVSGSLRGGCLSIQANVTTSPTWVVPHAASSSRSVGVVLLGTSRIIAASESALTVVDFMTGESSFGPMLRADVSADAIQPATLSITIQAQNATVSFVTNDGAIILYTLGDVAAGDWGISVADVAGVPCSVRATSLPETSGGISTRASLAGTCAPSTSWIGGFTVLSDALRVLQLVAPFDGCALPRPPKRLVLDALETDTAVFALWSCPAGVVGIVYGLPLPTAMDITLPEPVGAPATATPFAMVSRVADQGIDLLLERVTVQGESAFTVAAVPVQSGASVTAAATVQCNAVSDVSQSTFGAAFSCVQQVDGYYVTYGVIVGGSGTTTANMNPILLSNSTDPATEPGEAWLHWDGTSVFVTRSLVLIYDANGTQRFQQAVGTPLQLPDRHSPNFWVGVFQTSTAEGNDTWTAIVTCGTAHDYAVTFPVAVFVALHQPMEGDNLYELVAIPTTCNASAGGEVGGWAVTLNDDGTTANRPWSSGIDCATLFGASAQATAWTVTFTGQVIFSTAPYDLRAFNVFGSRLPTDPPRQLSVRDLRTLLPAGTAMATGACRQTVVNTHSLSRTVIVVTPTCHVLMLDPFGLTLSVIVPRRVSPGTEQLLMVHSNYPFFMTMWTDCRSIALVLTVSGLLGYEIPVTSSATTVAHTSAHVYLAQPRTLSESPTPQ